MIRNMYQSPYVQYSPYGEPLFDVAEAEKHFEDFWEVRVPSFVAFLRPLFT